MVCSHWRTPRLRQDRGYNGCQGCCTEIVLNGHRTLSCLRDGQRELPVKMLQKHGMISAILRLVALLVRVNCHATLGHYFLRLPPSHKFF